MPLISVAKPGENRRRLSEPLSYNNIIRAWIYFIFDAFLETSGNILVYLGLDNLLGINFRPKPDPSIRLDGQTVIVTGGYRGIGLGITRALVSRGATRVIVACRDVTSARDVLSRDPCLSTENNNVKVMFLDLSSLDSIKKFVDEVIRSEDRLDVLVNNAGILTMNRKTVPSNGWEWMFAVNYLGHVYLTMSLMDKMKQSSPDPRIIFITSMTHSLATRIDWEDVHWEEKSWSCLRAYGMSKLACLLFARELAMREKDIRAYSIDPGCVITEVVDSLGPIIRKVGSWTKLVEPFFRTVERAADCVVHAVIQPKERYESSENFHQDGKVKKPLEFIVNSGEQKLLWTNTMEMLGFMENGTNEVNGVIQTFDGV